MEEYSKIEQLVSKIPLGDFTRQGTVFKTEDGQYFYDAGTGKVFQCGSDEFDILEYLTSGNEWKQIRHHLNMNESSFETAMDNIIELVIHEKILQSPKEIMFVDVDKETLKQETDSELEHIILEFTENCNLRCKYCIFSENFDSFRTFTKKNMSWETAQLALDYANNHSKDQITIGFYGGEPLLNSELLIQCIEYCQLHFSKQKKVTYTFTSNLTLMTKELAYYFSTLENCKITCSLDGPLAMHDEFRVSKGNIGSFEKTLNGLKILVDALGSKAGGSLSINSVISPPFTTEKFNEIKDFFNGLLWLPDDVIFNMAYVDSSGVEMDEDEEKTFIQRKKHYESSDMRETDPIKHWILDNICQSKESKFEVSVEREELIGTHFRLLASEPLSVIPRNGCCTPGQRRLYVTSNGDFQVCEKIGDSPKIGDVWEGVDLDQMYKYYISEYSEKSIEDCSNCWARNVCRLCYPSCYDKGGLNVNRKKNACLSMKASAKNRLVEYYQILEKNPEFLDLMFPDKVKDY